MSKPSIDITLLGGMFKMHPWHGVSIGDAAPNIVNAYVEIVPTDYVKYEIDKLSGHLKVDRPQKYSSLCPTLYGFIPQTYCGDKVGKYCESKVGRKGIEGDGDPLDICILTEKPIQHGDILVRAIPIGGMRMLDNNEADDKIIAVLAQDPVYGTWKDITECPSTLIERLRHYFLTYKDAPGSGNRQAEITHIYSSIEAHEVIQASQTDYKEKFADMYALHSSLHEMLSKRP